MAMLLPPPRHQVYSLLQFLMSPLLGRASDVVGRTTMLRYGMLHTVQQHPPIGRPRPWIETKPAHAHTHTRHSISALASVGSYAAMLLAQDPRVFMLGRVLPGLVKCGISVSQAYLSDISPQHNRAKNLGAAASWLFGNLVGSFVWLFVWFLVCIFFHPIACARPLADLFLHILPQVSWAACTAWPLSWAPRRAGC